MTAVAVPRSACPNWCTLPPGHPFDAYETADGLLTRSHQHALPVFETQAGPSANVVLEAFEQSPGDLTDAELCLYFDYAASGGEITSTQARALAARLLEAADLWDVIRARSQA